MDGILNVYKEKDFTSHDVVAKLRGICHQKKIGHTGTLDPQAEGVLPVCLGKATKVCDLLTDKEKVYETVLRLGITTDTQDIYGEVKQEKPVNVTEEAVREAVSSFTGPIMQIPPMYSARKIQGKKLYELARAGVEVEREARQVQIKELDILEVSLPFVKMRVRCSGGTYIRTLCHDIGEKLGCGGCMQELLRTQVDRFFLKDSYRLSEIEELARAEKLEEYLLPVDSLFEQFPAAIARKEAAKRLMNGNILPVSFLEKDPAEKTVRIYDSDHRFAGLYERYGDEYQLIKNFYN